MTDNGLGAGPEVAPRRPPAILPSLNFMLLLLVFSGTGAALWHGWIGGKAAVFVFVVSGWIVSLCLHEFGHALAAHAGGDTAIAGTGYLSLDPLKYTDPVLSLVLPLVYIFFGGFGLPGGAVYIRTGDLRSRAWMAAVAAAGPLANLLFLATLAALMNVVPNGDDITDLQAGLAVLAFFQATAIVLNLLPFPGLDGFGMLRPYLPTNIAAITAQVGTAAFIILVLLLWYTSLGRYVFLLGLDVTHAFGIATGPIARGFAMIRLT